MRFGLTIREMLLCVRHTLAGAIGIAWLILCVLVLTKSPRPSQPGAQQHDATQSAIAKPQQQDPAQNAEASPQQQHGPQVGLSIRLAATSRNQTRPPEED